jgi:PTS system N-acetylglucosamine-specific IIC component
LQVVLGPIADQVAGDIRAALRSTPHDAAVAASAAAVAHDAAALLAALGGRDNVVGVEIGAGRLLIRTAQPRSIDESSLMKLGIRGIVHCAADRVQVLVAGPVEPWSEPLQRLL